MQVKYEWRKKEKSFYLPKNEPEIVTIPEFRFITIEGEGSPADSLFANKIATN